MPSFGEIRDFAHIVVGEVNNEPDAVVQLNRQPTLCQILGLENCQRA
ncbi:MAG: hypothetical protein ACLFWI_27075 [Coleofasciculus sp.]